MAMSSLSIYRDLHELSIPTIGSTHFIKPTDSTDLKKTGVPGLNLVLELNQPAWPTVQCCLCVFVVIIISQKLFQSVFLAQTCESPGPN